MGSVNVKLKENKVNQDGLAPLVLRIIQKRKPREVSLKMYIKPDQWDDEKQKVKRSHKNYSVINAYIRRKKREYESALDRLMARKDDFTVQEIINEVSDEGKLADVNKSFSKYLNTYIEENPDNLRYNTLLTYKATRTVLGEYKKDVKFGDLTPTFLKGFEKYLREEWKNMVNTIWGRMKVIRKMVNLARSNGMDIPNPFEQYKLKREKSRRRFLKKHEIEALEAYVPENSTDELILDSFLFACWTGVRFGDLCRLTIENLECDGDGYYLNFRMSKTGDLISFRLPLKAKSIVVKYWAQSDYLLPILAYKGARAKVEDKRISSRNAFFNRRLKEIALDAGIDKKPTFHESRHTAGTLALSIGIPAEVIQRLLGHSAIETTMIYAKIVDEQKEAAIDKLNEM